MRLSLRLRGLWDEPPSHARGAIAQLAERLDRTQGEDFACPVRSVADFLRHYQQALTARFCWICVDSRRITAVQALLKISA